MTKKIEGPSMDALKSVAKALNNIMELEPKIPIKVGTKKVTLVEEIKEVSGLIQPDDIKVMRDSTVKTLTEMGILPKKKEEKPVTEEKEESVSTEKEKPEKNVDVKEKPKKNMDYSKSNKAQVYNSWKKDEKDIEKLHKMVEERVKKATIKNWINQWEKGKNLPAIAK